MARCRARLRLPALPLALGLLLSACGERVAAPEVTASSAEVAPAPAASAPVSTALTEHRVSITHLVHADLPPMTFTLVAETAPEPGGSLRVRRIDIRRGTRPEAVQRIDDLSTDTPWAGPETGFEVLDMNFDGYADFRLVEARPAGPNLPYLNWLYDPASGQFVANQALNVITAPRFDAVRRELRSDWRDGATHYGTDFYAYQDGQPTPVRREARRYSRPDRYILTVSTWADGDWRQIDQREGRDP